MWKLVVLMRAFHPQSAESRVTVLEFNKQSSAQAAADFFAAKNGSSYEFTTLIIHDQ